MPNRSANDPRSINRCLADSFSDAGYVEDIAMPLANWKTSGLLTLTAGTTPTITVASNKGLITWAAADESATLHAMKLVGQFSNVARRIDLVGTFNRGGIVDGALTMTCRIYAEGGGVSKGPFTATATLAAQTAQQTVTFTCHDEADASGYKLEPGDDIVVYLLPGTHATDSIILSGAVLRIARNASLTLKADRYSRET